MLGATPPLVVLALTNYLKFGTFSPLSYGAVPDTKLTLQAYAPIVALGLGGLAALWLVTRQSAQGLLTARHLVFAGGLMLVASAGFVILNLRSYMAQLGIGGTQKS